MAASPPPRHWVVVAATSPRLPTQTSSATSVAVNRLEVVILLGALPTNTVTHVWARQLCGCRRGSASRM